ncbi:SDR family oxidoreductase [Terribacillus saccharophilus]|uniref:SDR family NAD(P)-dependent oxidoreductase n=1 Tax=Terribacillus saccharophilus TaxID=361277 RepID=UPI003981C712
MNVQDMFDLSNKVAVVTGSGSGLGAQLSIAMAEAGAHVVCGDVNEEGNQETVGKIKALGRKALSVPCDVSDEGQVAKLIQAAEKEFGQLDIAIAAAGISDPNSGLTDEYETDDWKKALDINLSGVLYTNREALKIMKKQRSGKIINISSMWGLAGTSGVFPGTAYSATKGAVINLTRELALQYAPFNIQVNAICPGYFSTNIGNGLFDDPEFIQQGEKVIPMNRIASAEEIKGTGLYLASAASNYTTGLMLVTDGGYLAQ